jgi:hypothetical protein
MQAHLDLQVDDLQGEQPVPVEVVDPLVYRVDGGLEAEVG